MFIQYQSISIKCISVKLAFFYMTFYTQSNRHISTLRLQLITFVEFTTMKFPCFIFYDVYLCTTDCPGDYCLVGTRCLYRPKETMRYVEGVDFCASIGAELMIPKTEEFFNQVMEWEFVTVKK